MKAQRHIAHPSSSTRSKSNHCRLIPFVIFWRREGIIQAQLSQPIAGTKVWQISQTTPPSRWLEKARSEKRPGALVQVRRTQQWKAGKANNFKWHRITRMCWLHASPPFKGTLRLFNQHCRFERDINHHEMEIRFNEELMFFGLRDTSNILLLRSTRSSQSFTVSLMTVKLFVGVCSLFKVITMFVPSGYVANYMAPVSFVESAPQSKHTPSPLHLRGIVDSPRAQKMTGDVQQRAATTMTRHARNKWAREAKKWTTAQALTTVTQRDLNTSHKLHFPPSPKHFVDQHPAALDCCRHGSASLCLSLSLSFVMHKTIVFHRLM